MEHLCILICQDIMIPQLSWPFSFPRYFLCCIAWVVSPFCGILTRGVLLDVKKNFIKLFLDRAFQKVDSMSVCLFNFCITSTTVETSEKEFVFMHVYEVYTVYPSFRLFVSMIDLSSRWQYIIGSCSMLWSMVVF